MGKYLMLWEIDRTKIPISPQERGTGWGALLGMIKQDMEIGVMKDWGAFVGEIKGYGVAEGTEVEIGILVQRYVPFAFFEVHPVASLSQAVEVTKKLSG